MPQVAFALCLYDSDADRYWIHPGHIYQTNKAARMARIALIKEAKADGDYEYDWAHWWCVTNHVTDRFGKEHTTYYTNPKDECGILIEECIVND